MSLQERLHPSSFRGAGFFIENSVLEGGRKQAIFEFVNTGRRSIQDLGQYQRKFEVTAYVMGNGEEYLTRRDTLLAALDEAGAGELIHPFFGSLTVATGKYKLDESTKRLGYSTISFVASVVDTDVISEEGNPFTRPSDEVTEAQVQSAADEAKEDLAEDMAENSVLIPEFPSNLSSMESIIQDGLSGFNDTLGPIAENVQNAISWADGIANLAEDTIRLINNPTVLFSNIIDGITGIDGLTSSAIRAAARLENLFSYGDDDDTNPIVTSSETILGEVSIANSSGIFDDPAGQIQIPIAGGVPTPSPGGAGALDIEPIGTIDPGDEPFEFESTSIEQISRRRNALVAVTMFQTSAYIEYMNQVARIDLDNTNQVDQIVENIEGQFVKLSPILPEATLASVTRLRTLVRILLDTRRININRLRTIAVQDEPLSVLSYNLYGNTDRSDSIQELNNISYPMSINGDIQVETNDSNRSER